MTSKISFFSLCVENMKRRMWLLVLASLTYFVSMPVALLLNLQANYGYSSTEAHYELVFSGFFSIGFTGALAAGFAIVCAVAGFAWLFSKKKVDLYHSIPVKRERLFLSIYLNGILLWLVPYLVSLLVCIGIVSRNLIWNGTMVSAAAITFGVNLLFFLLFYNLAIVAVMLTGNMINCLFTGGVLFGYAMCMRLLLEGYLELFLATYYAGNTDFLRELKFTSPIMTFLYFAEEFTEWNGRLQVYLIGGGFALYLLQCLIMAAIAGAAALLLYRHRPSEAAGKSIAFGKILNLYRILLVIPLALGSGLFFYAMVEGSRAETAWLIFGLLFGLVLSHGFIEVLFQMDIRAMFSYKRQLLATGVVVFLLAFSVKGDWYGINRSMPEKEDITSMAVTAGLFDGGYFYYQGEEGYYSENEWSLSRMELTDLDVPYALAKAGMEYVSSGEYKRRNDSSSFLVKYRLGSGKEIVKWYWLPQTEIRRYAKQLHEQTGYRNIGMGVLWDEGMEASTLELRDITGTIHYLDEQWIPEFLEIYRSEYEQLTFEEKNESNIVAEITMERYERDNPEEIMRFVSRAGDFPLYDCCTEAIRYLEDKGIDISYMQKELSAEEIVQLMISVCDRQLLEELGLDSDEKYQSYHVLTITDREEIAKLLPYLEIDMQPYRMFRNPDGEEEDFVVDVTAEHENGVYGFSVRLLAGSPVRELVEELQK